MKYLKFKKTSGQPTKIPEINVTKVRPSRRSKSNKQPGKAL